MRDLVVTVVRPAEEHEAESQFKIWYKEHPELASHLADDSVVVSTIRGCGPDGGVVTKRQYRIVIDDGFADLLVGYSDRVLDVVVISAKEPAEADAEFFGWWTQRPMLRRLIGECGYFVDDIHVAESRCLRQYRVEVPESRADLLSPEASMK